VKEQGLFGGKGLEYTQKNNWNVIGFLNNDTVDIEN
jgi:hypothetical protein